MVLPNKRLEADIKRNSILTRIISALSEEPLSIAQISRRFELNRSTTRYYLGLLKQEQTIVFERQEHLPGRPTFVKINEEKAKKDYEEMRRIAKEHEKKMEQDPVLLEVMAYLKKNKKATEKEVLAHIKSKELDELYISKTLSALMWLEMKEKIQKEWRLK